MGNSSKVWWTRSALGCLCGLSFILSACGPVQSTQRVGEATVALERARVAEADQKAPYEYYSAKFYLHKSKEEWGYSDFEASYDYATEAKRAAEAALLKAKEDPWTGSPVNPRIKPVTMRDTGRRDGNPAKDPVLASMPEPNEILDGGDQ